MVGGENLDQVLLPGREPLEGEGKVQRGVALLPHPAAVEHRVVLRPARAGVRRGRDRRLVGAREARGERDAVDSVPGEAAREDLRAVAAERRARRVHRRDLPADGVGLGIDLEPDALHGGRHDAVRRNPDRAGVPAVGEVRELERGRGARLRRGKRRLGARVELVGDREGRSGRAARVRALRHVRKRDRRRRAADLRGGGADRRKHDGRGAGRRHRAGDRGREDLLVGLRGQVQELVGIVAVALEVHLAAVRPVGVQELAADVDEDHAPAVREGPDDLVRRLVVGVVRGALRGVLRVRVAVGDDRHQEDLRLGMLREDEVEHRPHARGDVRGILARILPDRVVRADQQVEELRRVAVDAAALEAPQQVLHEVAGPAEVQDAAGERVHGRGAVPLHPLLREGVAEEDEVEAPAVFADELQVVLELPPEGVLQIGVDRRRERRDAVDLGTRRRHEVGGHRGAARRGGDVGRDRLGPDLVAGRVQRDAVVVEERGLQRVAVVLEEEVRHVDPGAALLLRVRADVDVQAVVARAHGVGLVEPAGKHRLDDDLRRAEALDELVDDRADAQIRPSLGLLPLGVDRGVVAADHQEDRLGAAELAVPDAPEDVLRAVAGEAEVEHRPVAGEVRGERGRARRLPALRQLVAEEDDVLLDGTVGHRRDLFGVARRPPGVEPRGGGVRADGYRGGVRSGHREDRRGQEREGVWFHREPRAWVACPFRTRAESGHAMAMAPFDTANDTAAPARSAR